MIILSQYLKSVLSFDGNGSLKVTDEKCYINEKQDNLIYNAIFNDEEELSDLCCEKKGFGPFKKKMWDLPDDVKDGISTKLETKFSFISEKLNVFNTMGRCK